MLQGACAVAIRAAVGLRLCRIPRHTPSCCLMHGALHTGQLACQCLLLPYCMHYAFIVGISILPCPLLACVAASAPLSEEPMTPVRFSLILSI